MKRCRLRRTARSLVATLALACAMSSAPAAGPARDGAGDGERGPMTGPASGPKIDAARFDYGLSARPLAEGVWVVEGTNADFEPANGCNIINTAFIATGAGVLVINTGPSKRYGEQLRALISRTTAEPIAQVIHLNLHPDYFLGNQAFADVPRAATAATIAGMQRESKAYEDNLYRMCGDWMRGTESLLPGRTIELPAGGRGSLQLGGRHFDLHELAGHTASDLVLVDRTSGIAFVGGLVFVDRIPTTPHADLPAWLRSLDRLDAMKVASIVESHGPVGPGLHGIGATRDYLRFLDQRLRLAAEGGAELSEVLRSPLPEPFARWAAASTEYVRNVVHLYPAYERKALEPALSR